MREAGRISYLDHVIFERVHWRAVDRSLLAAESAAALMRNADLCPAYRRIGDAGVTLGSGEALVPSSLFKRQPIVNERVDIARAKACTSSGTLGTKSIVFRDDETLERFVGTVAYGIEQFLGSHDRRRAFVIGPSAEEAGDLWFSYVLSLVDVLYQTDFYVREGKADFGCLYEDLAAEDFYQPILVGPPALVADFLAYLERRRLSLDLGTKEGMLVTAGGWKDRAQEQIPQASFRSACAAALNLPDQSIRDSFNMVELNTVLFECAHHRMHLPPWLRVNAVDPGTMVRTDGEGVLCFLDPTPTSYPGAILSEDVGEVVDAPCPCGVESPSLIFRRRIKSNEQRGCGLKMSGFDNV